MYWTQTPKIIRSLFPSITWQVKNKNKEVFLTFDDGPTASVTNLLLDILHLKQVKASFFCLGSKIENNPKLFARIKNEGHLTANHGYFHVNGWKSTSKECVRNISKASRYHENKLFRPPYGKLTFAQKLNITKNYKIIMWDILSGDFDPKISVNQCLNNVINNIQAGSIIVFHDNLKSKETMLKTIPILIDQIREMGYNFETLELSRINNLSS